nr:phage tail protein [Acinetobacter haemolyticus]
MRCMPVWNGQTLTFVQDRPSDKTWTYNRSNVVMPDDGAPFRYSFSALKDRHNAVEVNWIDPNNLGRSRRTITRRRGNTAVSGTERLNRHTATTWPGVCGIC